MTNYETIAAEDFGRSLNGLGLNLLVRDVAKAATFLQNTFDMTAHRLSKDFAIMSYGQQVFQLHADHTYHQNPYLAVLPETPPRGAGIELRLYNTNPDTACAKVINNPDIVIVGPPMDKHHGLREAYILDHDGYTWVPSSPLKPT